VLLATNAVDSGTTFSGQNTFYLGSLSINSKVQNSGWNTLEALLEIKMFISQIEFCLLFLSFSG